VRREAIPPTFKLQVGDGATIAALATAGLGAIIRITSGTGVGQLRMIAAAYSAGAFGADVIAINRDWGTLPDATSTYDIAFGMLFEIAPNPVKAITRLFATVAADAPGGAQRVFYEKVFAINTNAATALTAASIEVLSETPALPTVALDLTVGNGVAIVNAPLGAIAIVATAPATPGRYRDQLRVTTAGRQRVDAMDRLYRRSLRAMYL
jgi:hypothetical protein